MPKKRVFALKNLKIIIENTAKNPPPKLKKKAMAPFVISTKKAFKKHIDIALFGDMSIKAYIVTMLESPIFIPGKAEKTGGSKLSIKDKTRARAKSTAVKESEYILFFIFSVFAKIKNICKKRLQKKSAIFLKKLSYTIESFRICAIISITALL